MLDVRMPLAISHLIDKCPCIQLSKSPPLSEGRLFSHVILVLRFVIAVSKVPMLRKSTQSLNNNLKRSLFNKKQCIADDDTIADGSVKKVMLACGRYCSLLYSD